MNKRALSDIITTVLIILLAIAAVVLIWSFIKKPIETGGEQIGAATDCFALKLKPTSCNVSNFNATTKKATVTVQWEAGDVTLSKMNVIVADKSGLNVINSTASVPTSLLGTATADVLLIGGISTTATDLTASAVGVIKTSSGEEATCTSSQVETIACT